ncbi:sulfur carrier protein ThiS [Oceanobacter mangrovi]|uniref:sulfur carrier protein ThiS n=1 Tax=Oceanobacter mangrovi TaxID=2862510 RepID=UPI001C8E8BC5|nr:MoaD/ThiS family protein [Oceanobacter mangrovi]
MKIRINGEWLVLAADSSEPVMTLEQLLLARGYLEPDSSSKGRMVVARNQVIVSQPNWSTTGVEEGDSIDVMGAITGG